MKTLKNYILLSVISVVLLSCSIMQRTSNDKFLNSTVVPAAEGTVQVKKDKNNNYNIKINIWNLAEPDKLDPAKDFYVVWMNTKEDSAKNIGQIKPQKSISKVLKATIQTVSPVKPTKVFITAENDVNVTQPGDQVVLTTEELK